MASTASLTQQPPTPTAPPPPLASQTNSAESSAAESAFKHRMDQFLSLRQSHHREADAGSNDRDTRSSPLSQTAGDFFQQSSSPNAVERINQYHETSATSGSNSGDEDDRESAEGGTKRQGGHFNGLSSKKRRKQSKPIRLGSDAAESGGRTSSPEPGECLPSTRYSTEEELEEGERRNSDGPLNLSAGREEGEKPSLRVLNHELMTQGHSREESSKSDLQIPTSLYQNMLPFGLPPFPFPFPSNPASSLAGKVPPTSAANLMNAGGKIQIFNPEAYCELCNKEFCNKYFLKTHKANKHGIYSDSPSSGGNHSPGPTIPPTTSASGGNSLGLSGLPPPAPRSEGSSDPQVGPPTPNSQAGSPFSGAFIAANMSSLRPPFLPLSPGASPSPTSSHMPGHPRGEGENGHREPNSRGESPGTPNRPSSQSMISPKDGENRDEKDGKENKEMRRSLESPRMPSLSGLPPHLSNFNPMMFGGLPSLDSLRKEEEKRMAEAGQQRPLIPNIPSVPVGPSGGGGTKGPFSSDKLRQMGVINADAFCEICCKEFCNKYFLRVHKLKKHGICSPDLPPEKVQKILNQMAKEAGKTGNPPPPIIRPNMMSGQSPPRGEKRPSSSSGIPSLGSNILPPHLRAPGSLNLGSKLMQLPPLEPLLPQALKDLPQLPNTPNAPQISSSASPSLSKDGSKSEHDVIKINDDSEDGLRKQHDIESFDKDSRSEGEKTPGRSDGRDKESSETPAAASEDLQRLQSMIMELNKDKASAATGPQSNNDNSALCKICNKDMENKYFLRAHMMNEHGVLHMEEPPQLPIDPSKSLREEGEKQSSLFPLMNGNNGEAAGQSSAASVAADFASKILQQMQRGCGLGTGMPFEEGESFLERVKSELQGGSPKKMDKDPNRKPASLSRSYCEICKKELCNKYFMKTHMMKMHGINIEGVNPNGVACHLCGKEMCSKYFLKVHLQNSHGVLEDGSPVPQHLRETQGGLFTGLFPPPPEMLGLPSSPDKDRYFSRLLGEQSEISRERLKELERQKQMGNGGSEAGKDGAHTCSLCGDEFPEMVALQVHIIKSHGAFPPETNVFGGKSAVSPKPKSSPGSESGETPPPANGSQEKKTDQSKLDHSDENAEQMERKRRSSGQQDEKDQMSVSSSATPTTSSAPAFPFPGLEGLIPTSMANSEAAKQFPHIEMLQRHMLSTQFPGLINPLLGFPGLPGNGGSNGGLPFPNPLQQLLTGTAPTPPNTSSGSKETPPSDKDQPGSITPSSRKKKRNKTSFKCSKCQQRFTKRQACLKHIQINHRSLKQTGRKQLFSPLKRSSGLGRSTSRSQYVRQLMELLRFPTTRGTPQSPDAKSTPNKHIMQRFLMKAPTTNSPSSSDETDVEMKESDVSADINFVPSLVYLPVAKRVSEPVTISFNLTPA